MKVRELFFANGDWVADTKLKVLGRQTGVLYEGVFIDMPTEIEDSRVVTFKGNLIVIR